MTGPGYDLYVEAVYELGSLVTSTSSSSPTALDTSNLQISFEAPSDGQVGIFYTGAVRNSPAGGVLCVAEGSSVVSLTRVGRTVPATESTPGAYERTSTMAVPAGTPGAYEVDGIWYVDYSGWFVDLDPTTNIREDVHITGSYTLTGLSSGSHTFDLAIMGYGGANVTAFGLSTVRVYRERLP